MTSSNSQHIRDELVDLFDQQLNTLEDEVFGVVNESQLREYQFKKDRIAELCAQLSRKAAA